MHKVSAERGSIPEEDTGDVDVVHHMTGGNSPNREKIPVIEKGRNSEMLNAKVLATFWRGPGRTGKG